ARLVEQRGLHGNLTLQVFEVLHRPLGLVGDDLVAGAVVAQAFAERDMDIDRQALGVGRCVTCPGGSLIIIHREGLMKLRRGRIGGVARAGPVILLDQGTIEADFLRHWGLLPSSRIPVKCTASSLRLHGRGRPLRLSAAHADARPASLQGLSRSPNMIEWACSSLTATTTPWRG